MVFTTREIPNRRGLSPNRLSEDLTSCVTLRDKQIKAAVEENWPIKVVSDIGAGAADLYVGAQVGIETEKLFTYSTTDWGICSELDYQGGVGCRQVRLEESSSGLAWRRQ